MSKRKAQVNKPVEHTTEESATSGEAQADKRLEIAEGLILVRERDVIEYVADVEAFERRIQDRRRRADTVFTPEDDYTEEERLADKAHLQELRNRVEAAREALEDTKASLPTLAQEALPARRAEAERKLLRIANDNIFVGAMAVSHAHGLQRAVAALAAHEVEANAIIDEQRRVCRLAHGPKADVDLDRKLVRLPVARGELASVVRFNIDRFLSPNDPCAGLEETKRRFGGYVNKRLLRLANVLRKPWTMEDVNAADPFYGEDDWVPLDERNL